MSRSVSVVAVLAALMLVVTAGADAAVKGRPGGGGGGGGAKSPAGYDISYPQCGGAFPTNVSFGIVGVNDGIVYSANPCLGAGDGPSELAWAESYEAAPIFYANTADPGPTLSSHWPTGQTTPEFCDPSQPDSTTCAYDYGWNAAADSYADAVDAYISLGQLTSGASRTPQPDAWWLDVESANSWEQNTADNVAALQGEVAYLQSVGAGTIGFYANATDWQTITGGTAVFSSLPSWRPGGGSLHAASSYCGATGVTGGPIEYSQYTSGGFDADVRCY